MVAETAERPSNSMWDPPFPSNVSTPEIESKGEMGIGSSEDGGRTGAEGGAGGGKLKSTLSPALYQLRPNKSKTKRTPELSRSFSSRCSCLKGALNTIEKIECLPEHRSLSPWSQGMGNLR